MSGVRPIGHSAEENTDEDGVEWFDTEAEALQRLRSIEGAYEAATTRKLKRAGCVA